MTEYKIQFKFGGVWMETNLFVQLVQELRDRFGLDANVTPQADGLTFTITEKHDQ